MAEPARPSIPLGGLSPLKLALLAQQERARSESLLRADPIAIIGMGCRLPGGVDDPASFWRLLREGVDAVCEVPAGRWDSAALYDPDPAVPGKMATKWGGFLDRIDGFDAAFFGILPREAEQMDPQQRLFLEVAIEALDHAGLPRSRLAGSRTGAFVASYYNEYAQLQANDPLGIDLRSLTGTLHSVLVNRLSYLLDLRGPSVSIDTACSSSLVAVHLACQSLRHGECDVALAGGVSLMIGETPMITLSKMGFMAPDGRCKTFDASADGFGRGEGCSVLILKRLADAIADGDRVLAVVRGSAVNQDGHSTVLAAPNGLAQQALIREALANAQVEPSRIGYVEAHGTGTALGDPIEVEALAATVGQPAPGAGPCLIGAAKANIGHLEAAAGATGVIKSVLVLQHGEIPPQAHFKALNPHISLAGTRLAVASQLTPWPAGAQPRCIGTSGFGVGGTNAHVILEEAPRLGAAEAPKFAAAPWLLPLSAQSDAALRALAARWVDFLGCSPLPLAALCAAAGERRSHYDHRLAVVGDSPVQMAERLRTFAAGSVPAGVACGRRPLAGPLRVAFVFSGQGQQWLGMGRELLAREPVFRDAIGEIDTLLRRHVPWSLLAELAAAPDDSRLDDTEIAQPAIFAVQVALAALWAHWGVRPDGVVGHSVGEIAALQVAGALALDEAVRIVVQRARFMQRATGQGAMAMVGLDEASACARIAACGERLSVGAVNSPRSVVLSGEAATLAEALAALEREGVTQRALPVNYAFHSAQMQPHADALVAALGPVAATAPTLPVYSTVGGRILGDAPVDAAYFGRNVRQPVRFADAVAAMLNDGFIAFVEVAAHPVLAVSIAECAEAGHEGVSTVASLRRGRPEREAMLGACAALYALGRTPDWPALQGAHAEVLDLPAYPWQRGRYWLRPVATAPRAWPAAVLAQGASLLARRLPIAGVTAFETTWPDEAPAWLADHRVGGRLLMPGMAMLETLRQAAAEALATPQPMLEDFVVLQPLVLAEGEDARSAWQVVVGEPEGGRASAALYGNDPATPGRWLKVASARAGVAEPAEPAEAHDLPAGPASGPTPEGLYEAFARIGVAFGPTFRTVQGLALHAEGASAWLQQRDDAAATGCHPPLLDGALQACVAALGGGLPAEAFLPLGLERFTVWQPLPPRVRAELRVAREAGSLVAQVALFDERGCALARLDGMRFAPAGAVGADDWLHEVVWRAVDTPAATGTPGAWLLLADDAEAAEPLAQALRTVGSAAAIASSLVPLDDAAWRRSLPLVGVVLLAPAVAAVDTDALLARAVQWVQGLARHPGAPVPLVIVTLGAQPAVSAVPRPAAASLWGLGSTISVEHPELALRLIDLDPDAASPDWASLAAELGCGPGAARRLALRAGQTWAPRLRVRPALPAQAAPTQLAIDASGTLDGLRWQPLVPRAPGVGELRLRAVAAGLNFRDVLMALGMIPGQRVFLGAECAGIVDAVGPGVSDVRVGDAVFCFAPGALATEVVVPAAFVAPWPDMLGSLERAASLPVAYLTAMLGLQRIAGLRAGQRVLVHAAAGGVGLAAVRLALRVGAEVFATAGSPAKREMLRALGVAQVFDSRTLDFAAQVRQATGDAGVDVVLNSLSGDFIGASVEALAPRGCFLELGKRELWSRERFAAVRPQARYEIYDLGAMAQADPGLVRPMLDDLVDALRQGTLPPLPLRVFEAAQAPDAFRLMAQARHTGKLVLRLPMAADLARDVPVRADASYLITGGLGALGLHTARWLVQRGARHVVLLGRRAPGAHAAAVIAELQRDGAQVQVQQADAADADAMRVLLDHISQGDAPLRGVVHAAGHLDDGVLLQLNAERLTGVRRGKAVGAQVLDALTRTLPLDFFVFYSAVSLLLGPAGQGAYAAANAELDALAHARRAAGLPALSVAWSLWRDGGMATDMAAAGQDGWSSRGLHWIEPAAGLARLARLLREGAVHAAVLPIDWPRFLSRRPEGVDADFFCGLGAAPRTRTAEGPAAVQPRAAQWRALPQSQRRDAVIAHLAEQALQVLGLSATTALDSRVALKDVGLDSLMAVELRNLLARSIGTALPATLLFDHPTLDALAAFLLQRLDLAATPAAAGALAAATQHAELSAMSDEEAEAHLLAELDGGTPPRTRP